MEYFFKYTSINEHDLAWELFLNVAGTDKYLPYMKYPASTHPSGYFFEWEKGRVLDEYQLVFITEGEGEFETRDKQFSIKPGSVMLLRKNEWHRYRPNPETGWTENYIGFNGKLADFFLKEQEILKDLALVNCGNQEVLIDTFHKIFDLVKNETPCYQQIASGLVIKLLGYVLAGHNHQEFLGTDVEKIIQDVCFIIRENATSDFNFEEVSMQYEISSSHLRKMFKKYTGKSPHQYYLDIKLINAKEALLNTDKTIKQIAYEMGFVSVHYFSRIFKAKTGKTPSEFRNP
ncbi:MAG: AraC family transcriptional regulator [Bacteroidota bacterium]|nr:AraC family transcriptional regulator [Bacteroidota bacterium]